MLPGGGSLHPTTEETLHKRLHYIKMRGNETFKAAVKSMEAIAIETLKSKKAGPISSNMTRSRVSSAGSFR